MNYDKLPKTREFIEKFLEDGNKRSHDYSPKTKLRYQIDLSDFFGFVNKEFNRVTIEDCRKFKTFLKNKKIDKKDENKRLKPKSINFKIATIRAFYRFAVEERLVKFSPMVVKLNSEELKPSKYFIAKQILSREDVKNILEYIKTPRDRAILQILINTGCRISELTGLTISDVDLDQAIIKFNGKGSKERGNCLNLDCLSALHQWMLVRESKGKDELFLTKFGNPIDDTYVRQLIHRACVDLGIMKKEKLCRECQIKEDKYCKKCSYNRSISCHSFRHTFITWAIEDGVNLVELSGLVGHSSIDMTIAYTDISKLNNTYLRNFKGVHKI